MTNCFMWTTLFHDLPTLAVCGPANNRDTFAIIIQTTNCLCWTLRPAHTRLFNKWLKDSPALQREGHALRYCTVVVNRSWDMMLSYLWNMTRRSFYRVHARKPSAPKKADQRASNANKRPVAKNTPKGNHHWAIAYATWPWVWHCAQLDWRAAWTRWPL